MKEKRKGDKSKKRDGDEKTDDVEIPFTNSVDKGTQTTNTPAPKSENLTITKFYKNHFLNFENLLKNEVLEIKDAQERMLNKLQDLLDLFEGVDQ